MNIPVFARIIHGVNLATDNRPKEEVEKVVEAAHIILNLDSASPGDENQVLNLGENVVRVGKTLELVFSRKELDDQLPYLHIDADGKQSHRKQELQELSIRVREQKVEAGTSADPLLAPKAPKKVKAHV